MGYDAHAADLLFQFVSHRYEQKSMVITTNLLFKQWDTVFPNAACAVALIDSADASRRDRHHRRGSRIRKREAEQAQKAKQVQKPPASPKPSPAPRRPDPGAQRRSRFTRFYKSSDGIQGTPPLNAA